jgi:hypothetical protein
MTEDVLDHLGLFDQADDLRLMVTPGTTERVYFPNLLDQLSPGFWGNAAGLIVGNIQYRHIGGSRREGTGDAPNLLSLEALQHLVARDIESRKISRIGWDTFWIS